MSDTDREGYATWLWNVEHGGVTPPPEEYLRWLGYDDNLPWRLEKGHLVNLIEALADQRDDVSQEAGVFQAMAYRARAGLRAVQDTVDATKAEQIARDLQQLVISGAASPEEQGAYELATALLACRVTAAAAMMSVATSDTDVPDEEPG